MRLLADMHISPWTVRVLRERGHNVVRVNEVMPATSPDEAIVDYAVKDARVILTQDLRFSAILAAAGRSVPSRRGWPCSPCPHRGPLDGLDHAACQTGLTGPYSWPGG
jgi:hypothetical protein